MLNFMLFITFLGSWKFILLLNVIITVYLFTRKQVKLFLIIAASSLSNLFIVEPLKLIFRETRPLHSLIIEHSFSFPSGHAYSAATVYGLLTYILYKKYKNKFILIFGTLFILLISYSRLYLGVHYLHDVIFGIVLGLFWLSLVIKYINVN